MTLEGQTLSALADGLDPFYKEKRLPISWKPWLTTVFPVATRSGFAGHHAEFWRYVWDIGTEDEDPRKNILFMLARGGGKSTTAEIAAVTLAVMGKKRVIAYVCGTLDQANDHLASIKRKLESKHIMENYPLHSKPRKYIRSRGSWNQTRVVTAGGAYFVAFGLEGLKRGFKDEDFRPDLIIIDDVDSRTQSQAAVLKKLDILSSDILPMGSAETHVMFIQNPVHRDSVLDKVHKRKTDMLTVRKTIGPVPAIMNAEFEQREYTDEDGEKALRFFITAGTATWDGQSLTDCQQLIDTWGYTTFLREAQHKIDKVEGSMFGHLRFQRVDYTPELLKSLVKTTVWVDPAISNNRNSDSMGIQADGIDEKGRIYRLFSWEQIASPEEAIRKALLKAVELGSSTVGIETDQGGMTWRSVYYRAWDHLVENNLIPAGTKRPQYKYAKAGSDGAKAHRASKMLVDYEHGRIFHVRGTHDILEDALTRFPIAKPFDLTDAAYWSWKYLRRPVYKGSSKTVNF